MIEPLGYLQMLIAAGSARLILTDSGGLQKEACWLGVPCVTLRDETEWVETVETGWNTLAGTCSRRIVEAVRTFTPPASRASLYGDGQVSARCVELLEQGHLCLNRSASPRDPVPSVGLAVPPLSA